MDIDSFYRANLIYSQIELVEEKKIKLIGLKDKIIEILEGHTEIPEEKIFDIFRKIDGLNEYLKEVIKEEYNKIDEL